MPTDQWGEGTWGDASDEWGVAEVPETPPPDESPVALAGAAVPEFGTYIPPTPKYRVLVGPTLSRSWTEELPLLEFDYSFVRNAPGAFSGSAKAGDFRVIRSNVEPAAMSVYVERDGVLVWGGPIWNLSIREDTVRLQAEGFWSHFRRIFHTGVPHPTLSGLRFKKYSNVDKYDVVRDLIAYAQGSQGLGLGADKYDLNINMTVDGHLHGVTTTMKLVKSDFNVIAEIIEEMAEDHNGFDFDVSLLWSDDGTIRKNLNLFLPYERGNTLVFDDTKNCTVTDWSIDGSEIVRSFTVTGTGRGTAKKIKKIKASDAPTGRSAFNELLVQAEDGTWVPASFFGSVRAEDGSRVPVTFYDKDAVLGVSVDEPIDVPIRTSASRFDNYRPAYEDMENFSEQSSEAALASRAARLLADRLVPEETVSLEIRQDREMTIGAWRTGDYSRVRLRRNSFQTLDESLRIIGWKVTVGREGQEKVDMDFAPFSS